MKIYKNTPLISYFCSSEITLMRAFFRTPLFKIEYFNFTVADLLWSLLLLLSVVLVNYILRKLLRRMKNRKVADLLDYIGVWITLVTAISLIVEIANPLFWSKNLYYDALFKISHSDFIFVLSVPVLAFFVVRLLRFSILKPNAPSQRNSLVFIAYLIWSISLSYIAKVLFRNFSQITDIELLVIQKVSITLFDVWFLTIVISVTFLTLRALKSFFEHRSETMRMDAGTSAAIFQIFKYLVWIFAIILSLQVAGFDITLLLAGSAALLVGLGMGIQKLFSDVASGVILLLERPLKGGDVVETSDGMIGIVQHIGLRTTTLLTRDDTVVRVPNSTFINENIENYTDEVVETRFDVIIGVAYGSDIELVMKILKECAVEHPKVEKTPEPVVLFSDFGDWALKFTLYFWTFENFRFEGIKSDIRIAINREFLKHDIKIPVPQSDVRILI